ncbi:G-protein coupled receptors family 1 profile domain-containing protein [Caenorhabditis elegans]|uniref:G-protein coupled receptors family 1 profile domain-containing protein n=1 Tax=Caenorhabditis elegans TaxID=6239 RepID=O76667_CAEEL|nr:G-protein coupled receptors family 1 profile domain-containing protein [Caenorhabditis elegans]CCD68274.2 G-protein coupled receptors family 1 profile domain-containing protein [Caenorhabditis elegans]
MAQRKRSQMTTDIISVAQHVITTSYITVILFGNIGNVWVSWKVGIVFVFDKSSLVPRNIVMLILFICVADLLVLLHLTLFVHFQFEKQWIFGNIVCKSFYCIEVVNKLIIPLALLRISRESYESVRMTSHKCSKKRRSIWNIVFQLYSVMALIAVGVLTISVLIFAETRTYEIPRHGELTAVTMCIFHPPHPYAMVFNILAFVFGYGFTSAAYMYFYLRVPMILKRRYSSIKTTSSNSTRFNHQSILKIRHTVNAFVVVYMACWTPYWALFWLFFTFPPSNNWMVIISQMAHLLPYISCAAYPIILTFINKGIRNAHSTIMTSQRKKLMTIRAGAYQMITAQLGFVQTWLRDDNTLAPTLIRPRWSSSGSVVPTEIHVESVVEDEETEPAAPQIYL